MRKRETVTCLAILLILLILVPSSYAQRTRISVDGERIKSLIAWMADDAREGRNTLSEGYNQTAEWAANNFQRWGLKPAGEDGTYFQKVPISRGINQQFGLPELRVGRRTFLNEDGDFSMEASCTVGTRVSGDVVFVGYGISAPGKGLDEYADVDVEDKFVLVLKGSPSDVPAGRSGGMFGPARQEQATTETWEEESTDQYKIQTAYDKGAAGVLLYDPGDRVEEAAAAGQRGQRGQRAAMAQQVPAQRGQRGAGGRPAAIEMDRDFLTFTITASPFYAIMKPNRQDTISGFNTRFSILKNRIKRKQVQSKETDIRVTMKGYDRVEVVEGEDLYCRNVLAKLEGTDPELKDQYIIMGGHMDHLGTSNGIIRNGADDNASGTAVAMEVGRVLAEANFQSKRTIIFCCWTGEEKGLVGSTYYVNNPCDGVSMDRVVTYFNMDMVGLGERIGAPGALNFPTIYDVIKGDQASDVFGAVDARTGGPGGSDHSAFIRLGIEAMALMTSGGDGHPDYHRAEDDIQYIDPEILRKTGQFVLQGTINLANETEVELLIPNRQHIYNAMNVQIVNFNPDLEGSTWVYVEIADNKAGLEEQIKERAAAQAQAQAQLAQQVQMRARQRGGQRGGGRVNQGIKDLKVFAGDTELLKSAAQALGFGRVDVREDDGTWFADGQLTSAGREALGVMEENNIAVNLIDPPESRTNAMLAAATKPFIITGTYTINEDMFDPVNEKGVLLGINFDPENVEDCLDRLVNAKDCLGDSDNLVLFVTSLVGLDEVKNPLYMGLIEKGWEASEIGGGGGRRGGGGTGVTGGNLGALSARPGLVIR
ncbi:M28 family peptidase [Planctomycetota bacterium]